MNTLRNRKRQRNTRPALESLDLRIAPSGVAAGAFVAGAQTSPMYIVKGEPPRHPSPTPIFQPMAGVSPMYRIKGEPPPSNPPSPVIMPYAR